MPMHRFYINFSWFEAISSCRSEKVILLQKRKERSNETSLSRCLLLLRAKASAAIGWAKDF